MKFYVRLLAFHENDRRLVEIPDELLENKSRDDVLNLMFHYGQNDFQPRKNQCSVSVGDVMELKDSLYLVLPVGFKQITSAEFDSYVKLPRRERAMSVFIERR